MFSGNPEIPEANLGDAITEDAATDFPQAQFCCSRVVPSLPRLKPNSSPFHSYGFSLRF